MITMELHARYGDPPRLCFHTMDPGTVDTKMLRAGWGAWGSPVSTATTSFEMLTQDQFQKSSGSGNSYCCGEGEASRRRLWDQFLEDTASVLQARLFLHEYDHLDGIVFTDRLGESSKKKVEPDLEFFIKDFQNTFPELEPAL
eukprot:symbB.v1.2.002467.t1/scaffold99.1/size346285/23